MSSDEQECPTNPGFLVRLINNANKGSKGCERQLTLLNRAKKELTKRYADDEKNSWSDWETQFYSYIPEGINTNNLIAQLTFPFWIEFFSPDSDWHKLWHESRFRSFSLLSCASQSSIHAELTELNKLRNAIAHYGPIFQAPLPQLYASLLLYVGLLSPKVGTLVEDRSYFCCVFSQKNLLQSEPRAWVTEPHLEQYCHKHCGKALLPISVAS